MSAIYILFGVVALALIVLVAVWFYLRRKKAKAGAAADAHAAGGSASEEIDTLIREAESRLAASKQADKLASLPVFLLLGETGSTKTSVMLNSGLEAELLAGQVSRDNAMAPTRTANVWFSRRMIFVEAGGNLPGEAGK